MLLLRILGGSAALSMALLLFTTVVLGQNASSVASFARTTAINAELEISLEDENRKLVGGKYVITQIPSNGSLTGPAGNALTVSSETGSFIFQPANGYQGLDYIKYKYMDSSGVEGSEGTIVVSVERRSDQYCSEPNIVVPALIFQKDTAKKEFRGTARPFAAIGGGLSLSLYRNVFDCEAKSLANVESEYSWSIMLLLRPRTEQDAEGNTVESGDLDLMPAVTYGVLNNLLQFGVGYNSGEVERERHRYFLLFSIGVPITGGK